jgi:hypothetical protein
VKEVGAVLAALEGELSFKSRKYCGKINAICSSKRMGHDGRAVAGRMANVKRKR